MLKPDIDDTGESFFEQHDLFISKGRCYFRIPSITVAEPGIVLAFANRRLDTCADAAGEVHIIGRRSPGVSQGWEPIVELCAAPGWHAAIGTVITDTENGAILLPYHRGRRNISDEPDREEKVSRGGDYLAISKDNGRTWDHQRMTVEPNGAGCCGSTHGASPGITLQHGRKKGRLIAPARYATRPDEELETLQKHHYNCTIYSDDGGRTWQTGGPLQVGTGEGCLVELSDGTIYYNSRAYFMDGKRRIARSYDGGETFEDFAVDENLVEPKGGCNAGMASVPVRLSAGRDLILLSNPAHNERRQLTVWLSPDGGRTWPVSKIVHAGPAAYSSLAVSDDGTIFILYENGEKSPYEKISLARFSLRWLTD
jgi:sialidase-1